MRLFRFLDFLFPPRCIPCGAFVRAGRAICEPCRSVIAIHETLFCATCRARLPQGRNVCHRDAPYLLGAATEYRDPATRALIHGLKFQGIRDAAEDLAGLLAAYALRTGVPRKGFTVVPLPLSPRRERVRGFNQSALIARRFAEALALPYSEMILRRTRHAPPQSEQRGYEERTKNVAGSFAARDASGARVLLIDDVVTSGATFEEAAQALRRGGARRVVALAVARA